MEEEFPTKTVVSDVIDYLTSGEEDIRMKVLEMEIAFIEKLNSSAMYGAVAYAHGLTREFEGIEYFNSMEPSVRSTILNMPRTLVDLMLGAWDPSDVVFPWGNSELILNAFFKQSDTRSRFEEYADFLDEVTTEAFSRPCMDRSRIVCLLGRACFWRNVPIGTCAKFKHARDLWELALSIRPPTIESVTLVLDMAGGSLDRFVEKEEERTNPRLNFECVQVLGGNEDGEAYFPWSTEASEHVVTFLEHQDHETKATSLIGCPVVSDVTSLIGLSMERMTRRRDEIFTSDSVFSAFVRYLVRRIEYIDASDDSSSRKMVHGEIDHMIEFFGAFKLIKDPMSDEMRLFARALLRVLEKRSLVYLAAKSVVSRFV